MNSPVTSRPQDREAIGSALGDPANPMGLDGIEFIEYATSAPQALGQVLETMGFRPVARHRSREVLLYRQGELNVVVNAHPADVEAAQAAHGAPAIAAIALRVRDARAAFERVRERGGWEVATHPEVMELNIPAIHGPGASRIYFVDRYREFSIYDVDFVPIPTVDRHPPPVAGLHFFGVVQYIGPWRSADWIEFYRELFGFETIPDGQRFGIMHKGTLMVAPALEPRNRFMLQLVESEPDVPDVDERLQRVGLGAPDVAVAVRELSRRGVEFVQAQDGLANVRGALTRTCLGSVAFELVQHQEAA
jgi:4-hydroxyphenylpyruvate dioxygenase